MKLSIIIVSYNTLQFVDACLSSIVRQAFRHNLEIIVVDNCSSDGSVGHIRQKFPQITLIENPANMGFAAANNMGIRQAKGEYILLLNSDTELIDNGLDTLIDVMGNRPDVAVVACRLLNTDGTTQTSLRRFPHLLSAYMDALFIPSLAVHIRALGKMTLLDADLGTEHDVQQPSGAFLMIRASVIEQIGVLDEHFFMYYEDVDYCKRVIDAGYRIVYYPAVAVTHHAGKTFSRHRWKATRYRLVSKVKYYRKYYPWSGTAIRILTSCELLIRMIPSLVRAESSNARADVLQTFQEIWAA